MKEMGDKNQQLRAGEILIIVVVLFMWAGVIALFCRQYDIIKDNEPNNNKEKAKNTSENSTPEHQSGGLLRSKGKPVPIIPISKVQICSGTYIASPSALCTSFPCSTPATKGCTGDEEGLMCPLLLGSHMAVPAQALVGDSAMLREGKGALA
ncbi:hypothetical protein Chor_001773 [Crotalus horridus]